MKKIGVLLILSLIVFSAIVSAGIDLTVSSVTFSPVNPTDTDRISATVTVKNIGNQKTKITDITLTYANVALNKTVSSLAAGKSGSFVFSMGKLVAGTYMVNAAVDTTGKNAESNEANNVLVKSLSVLPTTGSLSVDSTPSGASVALDGVTVGVSPLTVPSLSAGTHTVVLSSPGYLDYTLQVTITVGQTTSIAPTMAPVPTTGDISVNSTPQGADVFIDDVYKGVTPAYISGVTPGLRVIKISKAGYSDSIQTLNIVAGTTTFISQTLAVSTGSLSVDSTPQGASLYVDSVYKGATPVSVSGLSPGDHGVKLTKQGYYNYTSTATILGGQTTTISAALISIPTTGDLSVSSIPSAAQVIVDGQNRGTTPITITALSPGDHTLNVSKAGYLDSVGIVNIVAGAVTSVTRTLSSVPTTGDISVNTTPAGASIYLDGAYAGLSMILIPNVTAGAHNITTSLSGYLDGTSIVNVVAGSTIYVSFTLTPVQQTPQDPITGSILKSSKKSRVSIQPCYRVCNKGMIDANQCYGVCRKK